MNKKTILLYGRSGSGKTAQIGVLAEHIYKTTGKKTRLYTADRGGLDTILPHVELGMVELVAMDDTDPWIFLNKAVRGYIRDPKTSKWILPDNSNIGCFAFESMRGFAEALMESMKNQAAKGVNIGGGANVSFQMSGDGESLKISGSNMAHFGIAQSRITEEVWASQKLPADYIVWTTSVSKDEDTTSSGKILGPDVIGKALTAEVPRWFQFTFRIDMIPANQQMATKERHLLYLGTHVDQGAGGVGALGNIRMPLDGAQLEKNVIEPASLTEALRLIEEGQKSAVETLRKRLGIGLA